MKTYSLTGIVTKLGLIIAIPAILLVPIGFLIDTTYETRPIATLIGLGMSPCISSIFVMRLVKQQS